MKVQDRKVESEGSVKLGGMVIVYSAKEESPYTE